MTQKVLIEDEFVEDEISISDILRKLWRRRGLILAVTLLSLGLGIIYLFSSATVKRTPVTLFVELTSIKNGKYPNGADFSPMDLKSPDVLRVLIEKYKPKDESKFGEAITVNYGSDLMLGIHESYKMQLGAKGLTIADLQKINTDYKTALDEVARRGLEITFDYQLANLTKDEGRQVANDLPRIWNDVYLKKYKVLIDPELAEIATAPKDISLSKPTALIELSRIISAMTNGLKIITKDNRYSTIKNQEGRTAFDVLKDLDFFRNIHLLPMMAASVLKADPSSQAYAQSIRLQIDELNRNIASLDELAQQMISYQKSYDRSDQTKNKTTGDNLELSDSTLSEILKLSTQAALSDFLKDTLNSKRELSFKRSELQTEFDRLTNASNTIHNEEYTNLAEKKLSALLGSYQSLIDKIRSSATFNTRSFYTPIGNPEPFVSKWPDKSLLILALTTMMGLVFSTAIALLLPGKHQHQNPR